MFYCEECKDKRGWPESLSRSKGPCEICGEEAVCFDVRSCFLLPLPQKKMTFPIEHTPPRQYYSPAIQCLPELLYGDDSMYLLEEGEEGDDSDSKQR